MLRHFVPRNDKQMTDARFLTAGEIELARSVFGDAIDYGRVRIVRGKVVAVSAQGGSHGPDRKHPFSSQKPAVVGRFLEGTPSLQGLFIHEMTHVWQAQTRGRFYLPMMRHPFCRYNYQLIQGRPFARYGLEQQAEMVRHRFLADRGLAIAALPPERILAVHQLCYTFRNSRNAKRDTPLFAGAEKNSLRADFGRNKQGNSDDNPWSSCA